MSIPAQLSVDAFFDFEAHPFEHEDLFRRDEVLTVVDVLDYIGPYCREWLDDLSIDDVEDDTAVMRDECPDAFCHGEFVCVVEPDAECYPNRIIGNEGAHVLYVAEGASLIGGEIDLSKGSVYIGPGASVWGAWISGPAIFGDETTIRPGAYIRGNVIIGQNCTIRGELKNTVVMDDSDFPHPSYLGDSICGYHTHFGNQATAANVNIFGRKESIKIKVKDETIDLKRRKVGIIMGDYCQVGCNAVSDPGTLLLPRTIVYSLTRINSGVYGPDEVLKNKPMEHGVVERAVLRS
jgi:UDP-3-O-[3-hydroxymyristoyl] glucosamine N-acyltransferase